MNKLTLGLFALTFSLSAAADHHASTDAEVIAAVEAFNAAYANNEVDAYFDFYAPDASVYFYGERQDLGAYRDEWAAMVAAGGSVEKNELSDLRVQVMPGGDVAVASYFVDYRLRLPDEEISASRAFESEVWRKTDGEWKLVHLHYSEIPEDE
jgi:ketosteroid isomerase-like protein